MNNKDPYSELLHNSAIKWSLEEIPGRPTIGLSPAEANWKDGIVGDPYQPEMLPLDEVLRPDNDSGSNRIGVFEFNGQWGYCLSLQSKKEGVFYGAFLKFCDPCPTREAAIKAAARDVIRLVDGDKKLSDWAKSLLLPKHEQLSLFNL